MMTLRGHNTDPHSQSRVRNKKPPPPTPSTIQKKHPLCFIKPGGTAFPVDGLCILVFCIPSCFCRYVTPKKKEHTHQKKIAPFDGYKKGESAPQPSHPVEILEIMYNLEFNGKNEIDWE